MGDDEGNTLDSGSSESSLSLTGKNSADESEAEEFNLNCSFTGGYLPNTDLRRVDKGSLSANYLGI